MSHSSGNAVSVRELLGEGYGGREIRFYLLAQHYRQPLHFSRQGLDASSVSLRRLDELHHRLGHCAAAGPCPECPAMLAELRAAFVAALYDDLNIAAALAALFQFVRRANQMIDRGRLAAGDAARIRGALAELDGVLGVGVPGASGQEESAAEGEEIDRLLGERETARQAQDWERADAIRAQLAARRVSVTDTAAGPRWRKS
jgi:cysteinyl-tRNA synthetase